MSLFVYVCCEWMGVCCEYANVWLQVYVWLCVYAIAMLCVMCLLFICVVNVCVYVDTLVDDGR